MSDPIFFAFLFAAVVVGFLLGRLTRGAGSRRKAEPAWLRQSYFEGLNYLLNERPDAAIDTFVAALDVNSETLETHLALGNLLRRRGEVDRAIRIHQNLLARPSLGLEQQQQAQVELALDYMKSGLLDRAEALFKELLHSDDPSIRGVCLERLVEIYRDEKEWQRAIDMAEQLCHRKLGRNPVYWRELQAHFGCELAESAIQTRDWLSARQWVRKAIGFDRDCVRARLDSAHIEMALGQWELAVRELNKISSSSSLFISEALPLISHCYEELGRQEALYALLKGLYQQEPSELLLQQYSRLTARLRGPDAAQTLLSQELRRFPGLAPFADMLAIFEQQTNGRLNYTAFSPVLTKVLTANSAYECRSCGFTGQQLHWCCPTCKTWGSMAARIAVPGGYGVH